MRTIVYSCDACQAVLSDPMNKVAREHISIRIGQESGWVRQTPDGWFPHSDVAPGIYQFCNTECLALVMTGERMSGTSAALQCGII